MSGSVSLVNGHIDSDTKRMTPQEALKWVEDYEKAIKEEQAIVNNGDEFHVEALKVCEVVKQALEKQIPKKPNYEDVGNVYGALKRICGVCGDVCMVSKDAKPYEHYCRYCGNRFDDWGDIE